MQHRRGPSSCEIIEIGFQVKERRPVGGGTKGSALGSERPMPAGCSSAFSIGYILMPMRHCPIGSCVAITRDVGKLGGKSEGSGLGKCDDHGNCVELKHSLRKKRSALVCAAFKERSRDDNTVGTAPDNPPPPRLSNGMQHRQDVRDHG